MRNVRGANYRKVMDEVSSDLKSAALQIKADKGRLLIPDIGRLAAQFDLPVKTTFEFLEHSGVLPTGTWERLAARGLTARQVRESTDRPRS